MSRNNNMTTGIGNIFVDAHEYRAASNYTKFAKSYHIKSVLQT